MDQLLQHIFKYIFIAVIFSAAPVSTTFASEPEHPKHTGSFIKNSGQWNNASAFLVNLKNAQLFLEPTAFQYFFENEEDVSHYFSHEENPHLLKPYKIRRHALRVNFAGASEKCLVNGSDPERFHYNFFLGNNPERWKNNVPVYHAVNYTNLYDGIDMKIYRHDNGLKYDMLVKPGANPQLIRMQYAGASRLRLKNGNLIVNTTVNEFVETRPYAYQIINDITHEISCEFVLEENTITFKTGNYDPEYPLVIDPELIFSTFSGSSVDNFGHSATYDLNGNLYAAGIAREPTDFPDGTYPVTQGAFQTTWGGGNGSWPQDNFPCDISISKYNNDGSGLMYATYLGGNQNEYPMSLVVDQNNELVVLGTTLSSNYPTTVVGYDRVKSDSFDIVVTRFSASGGALMGSTFLGASGVDGVLVTDSLRMNYADEFRGEVQIAPNGDIVIVTSTTSPDMPVSPFAYQTAYGGLQDGFIARFDNYLTTLRFATYFGKEKADALYSLDIFPNNSIVVAGGSRSSSFTPGAGFETANFRGGTSDGIIAKFNPSLSALSGMRYWGSPNYDQVYFVKLDPDENVAVFGQGFDSICVTPGTYSNPNGPLFVSKFRPSLDSIILSTRMGAGGATNALSPSAFMIDVCGNIYGSVWGGVVNFGSWMGQVNRPTFVSTTQGLPITSNAFQNQTDGSDFWIFALKPSADSLSYATYFGEIVGADHVDGGTSRFDKRGIIYQSICASCGTTDNFPTTPGSFSPENKSPRCSNASLKFDFRIPGVLTADFKVRPRNGCADSMMFFENNSHGGQRFYWYLDNVLVDSSYHLQRSFSNVGSYTIKLVAFDSLSCNNVDSIFKLFEVFPTSDSKFSVVQEECGPMLFFKNESTVSNNSTVPFIWHFGDGDTSTLPDPTKTYATNGTYDVMLIMNVNNACADTAFRTIVYDTADYRLVAAFTPADSLRCEPTLLNIRFTGNRGQQFSWFVNDSLVSTSPSGFDSIVDKGIYKVRLKIEDSTTCTKADSFERVYTAFLETYPLFDTVLDSCSLSMKFINQSLVLPGDSVYFLWDFGDGTYSTERSPVHNYADTGAYQVKLTTAKGFPCELVLTKTIRIDTNARVVNANFTVNDPLCEPTTFTAENHSLNAVKYYWHMNGVLKDSSGLNYTDSVKQPGLTRIMLVAYNPFTCAVYDTVFHDITSYPRAEALFEIKRDSCSSAIFLLNRSTSQSQSPVIYHWDFGDGNTSTDSDPVYTYPVNGNYIITLITHPNTPCADTASLPITYDSISHFLSAHFDLTDTMLCTPAYLDLVSNGVNGKSFSWLLNDVLRQTGPGYKDTLLTEGIYSIKLVVSDSNSCLGADTFERKIEVARHSESSFVMRRDSCSLKTRFENLSGTNNVPFIWYFGDGDSSTVFSPEHEYAITGFYKVTLLYSPGTFCADTAEEVYFIDGDSAMEVKVPNVFTPNNDGINDCLKITGISPKCDEYFIKIYNRWGTVVFESTDGSQCWNGKNEAGNDIPPGVYYYILMIKKSDGFELNDHGTITLIRDH